MNSSPGTTLEPWNIMMTIARGHNNQIKNADYRGFGLGIVNYIRGVQGFLSCTYKIVATRNVMILKWFPTDRFGLPSCYPFVPTRV